MTKQEQRLVQRLIDLASCSQDIPHECNCGAEQHNEEVVKLAKQLFSANEAAKP